jgi:glycosyltransferase involved in cell wall biosynthesis
LKTAKKKLCIVINAIAPYRVPVYSSLTESFDVTLLHGGKEAGRTWSINLPDSLRAISVWSLKIPTRKRTGIPGVNDRTYLHLNLGLLFWLPKIRPDVIIANELGARTIMALLYGRLMRVPVWVWWGGTMHSEKNLGGLKRKMRHALSRWVKHWISYGVTSTEYLDSLGVERAKILQIQNCVEQETFLKPPLASPAYFSDAVRPVLLTVGQLRARKGVDRLIQACGRLARSKEFTLVVVGQGPERENLIALARSEDLTNVIWLQNQTQEELSLIYRSADAFIFPTMEDIWGLVVNEAILSGLPVLCSRYAGCAPELLDEENIFDPLSTDSWDEVLARIFDGTLAASDRTRLKTWQEVGLMIRVALLKGRAPSETELSKIAQPLSSRLPE